MSSPISVPSISASGSPKLREWIRDPEFWFSDGDVVLGIESTETNIAHLFRVHKPLLELHSPVFRNALSGNKSDKSRYDGARALWVPETSSKVLRYFLGFLYNPYINIPILTLNDAGLCDEFLKLCTGLKAKTACTPMLKQLSSIWPSSLSSWDYTDAYIFASAQQYPRMQKNDHGQIKIIFHDDIFPEPVSTIRLGRLYNIPTILPAALYHLSRIDPSSDYYKMHTEPTRSDMDSQQRLSAGLRSARWALLAAKDHHALAAFKDYVQSCLTELVAESSPHVLCRSGMERTYLDIARSSMETRDVLRELKLGFYKPHRICNSCIIHGRKVTSSMRKDIWDQLAVILGL